MDKRNVISILDCFYFFLNIFRFTDVCITLFFILEDSEKEGSSSEVGVQLQIPVSNNNFSRELGSRMKGIGNVKLAFKNTLLLQSSLKN